MENKEKIIQYICNLIMEYWEDKQEIPNEPKKILLGWIGFAKNRSEQDFNYIAKNIKQFFNYDFFTYAVFSYFIYYEVFNSAEFKLMCDQLRDRK